MSTARPTPQCSRKACQCSGLNHRHPLLAAVFGLMLAVSATSAPAQGMDVTPMIMAVTTNVTIDTWGRTSRVPSDSRGATTAQSTTPASAQLRVGNDPAISAQTERWMIDTLSVQADPAARARFAQAVRELRFRQQFEDMLRRNGADPRDLADVVAGYVALSWEVVQSMTLDRAQIGGLRRTVHEAVASQAGLRELPPAELQRFAEQLMYVAVAGVGFSRASVATPAQREDTRRQLHAHVLRTTGIDLLRHPLTGQGFRKN